MQQNDNWITELQSTTSRKHLRTKVTPDFHLTYSNQRTNGPVNAHLIYSGLVKHKTYKTWKIYGKEMTLTFNTHIPS